MDRRADLLNQISDLEDLIESGQSAIPLADLVEELNELEDEFDSLSS
jgi:uncharacterized protein Yka (UPF0111/DUF47 family)